MCNVLSVYFRIYDTSGTGLGHSNGFFVKKRKQKKKLKETSLGVGECCHGGDHHLLRLTMKYFDLDLILHSFRFHRESLDKNSLFSSDSILFGPSLTVNYFCFW